MTVLNMQSITLVMPAAMDISQVEAIHAELERVLQQDASVDLDMSSVERIDTPALQLLFAARKRLTDHGHDLTMSHVPEAVLKAAGLLGFEKILFVNAQAE